MKDQEVLFRKVKRIGKDLVSVAARLDVASVWESMSGEGLLHEDVHAIFEDFRIAGPAVTARNAPGDNLAMHAALDTARPGDVLVVAAGDDRPSATWGGQATAAAVGIGLAGVVTDGFVRDIAVLRVNRFPVWAKGVSPGKATKKYVPGVNVPIVCGGVTVRPGDLVLADDDGVVVVAVADAADVLQRAADRVEGERLDALELGKGVSPFSLKGMSSLVDAAAVRVVDGSFSEGTL